MKLEDLILLSQDSLPLALPNTFLCGPRLRRLHLTRIRMPKLLQLLHSSKDLEDLQLHEALDPWCFSLEELTDALSGLAQLQSISLHFSSTTNHVPPPSPPDRRVVLPVLTNLKFRGSAKYLERLILRMDTPRLEDIQVTVSEILISDLSGLCEFVKRIEIQKSYHQALILSSDCSISISLTQPGASTCFKFQLLSKLYSVQLFTMTYILPHISASLLNVKDLRISATQSSSQNSLYNERWLELLNLFPGVKWLHLDVNYSKNVVRVLQDLSWQPKTTLLPALYKLYLPHPGSRHTPLSEALASFMTSRWRAGYPISVEYECLCHISELHGIGTSLCTILLHYVLTFMK